MRTISTRPTGSKNTPGTVEQCAPSMATRYRRFDMLIFGLKKGEDYEFAKGEKKYVWEKTTFTNIYNTL